MPTATLVLEDGTILRGQAFGAAADAVFELVFNTSMTGYQEILTDPSYRGQGVLFTCSHIGNTGVNFEDGESEAPQVSAAVARALSPLVSNWRATLSLSDWLAQHGVPAISGVDTRYLTRKLRDGGSQKAALSTQGTSPEELLQMACAWPGLDGIDMVKAVSCAESYHWPGDGGDYTDGAAAWVAGRAPAGTRLLHIVAYDYGIKRNILRHLASYGAHITVVPADTPAAAVLDLQPDGVFLSNGPGDPAGLPYAVQAVRDLLQTQTPMLGICLGHQLLGLALGGRTCRLKFGHHGGNHPVQRLSDRRALITAQNHNYFVETESLPSERVEITHLSLNDGSLEGMRLRTQPVLSVQFHPEAAPGPHDAHDIFSEFFALLRSEAAHAETH